MTELLQESQTHDQTKLVTSCEQPECNRQVERSLKDTPDNSWRKRERFLLPKLWQEESEHVSYTSDPGPEVVYPSFLVCTRDNGMASYCLDRESTWEEGRKLPELEPRARGV